MFLVRWGFISLMFSDILDNGNLPEWLHVSRALCSLTLYIIEPCQMVLCSEGPLLSDTKFLRTYAQGFFWFKAHNVNASRDKTSEGECGSLRFTPRYLHRPLPAKSCVP